MISLPSGLEPWAPWLSQLLEQDTAVFLGELIARLSPLLGPLRNPRNHSQGEPDGYLGVGNRGTYDRLLASEWALADLAPDEFLRRAAASEHLFLQRAYEEPAGSLSCGVFFDTGPDQLGECRLMHLALLIALARRAQLAHAELRWGILQRPELNTWKTVTPESLQGLLEGRSYLEPTREQFEAWRLQSEEDGWPEELWIVGSKQALELPWPQKRIQVLIEESVEPEENYLSLSLKRADQPERQLRLNLPGTRLAARLLRSPFRHKARPDQIIEEQPLPENSLLFSQNEARLLCLTKSRCLLAFPIPNSPNAKPGKVKKVYGEPGYKLLGASWFRRRFVLAQGGTSDILIQGIGLQGGHRHPTTILERQALTDFELQSTATQKELRPFLSQIQPGQEGFYFLDDSWHLHRWKVDAEFPHSVLSHRTLQLGWLEHGGGLCFAELLWRGSSLNADEERGEIVLQVVLGLRTLGFQVPLEERVTPKVFFGNNGAFSHWIALQTGVDSWKIASLVHGRPVDEHGQGLNPNVFNDEEKLRLPVHLQSWHPPAGSQVLGILQRPASISPGLLMVEENKLQLWSPEKGLELLKECSAPILYACCGTRYDRVAYLTQAGEIGVYSISWGENLLCASLMVEA